MHLTNELKLRAIKSVHSLIYLMMVAAIFYTLYASITRTYGVLLAVSLMMLAIEVVVFAAFGMKCPFTDLAKHYGDPKGYVGDTFFPEQCTKYTFRVFGSILLAALLILVFNR